MEKNKINKLYVETYGCQMNLSDTEIIQGLMQNSGFDITNDVQDANVIIINTCSVREHAEERVISRIKNLRKIKTLKNDVILGIVGCMAERMKEKLFDIDDSIDLIIGPDEYRNLPKFILELKTEKKIHNTDLNFIETYDNIIPHRNNIISAWVPIMRGCDNFCSYCIVPYTRGRERSRSFNGILKESSELIQKGYKEIYLLGQNVNSYTDSGKDFSDLIKEVSLLDNTIRVRFMTSNPKDFSDKLIETIGNYSNICNYIHLPFQSGSNRILKLMNRNYTNESYLNLVKKLKDRISDLGLSTDIIVGFPTETDEDFKDTLNLLKSIEYDSTFTFKYSPREGTPAFDMKDDIPNEVKSERLEQLIKAQQDISLKNNLKMAGKTFIALAETESKKSSNEIQGRLDNNKVAVFPKDNIKMGDLVRVKVIRATSATLICQRV
jgi:tRNA-2-methylthio-N6-dimethylallyladenosine synthase